MGSGTHAGLALEVPLHPDTIRKEGRQLPGTHQGRLYPAVVPSSAPLVPFEIVTKGRLCTILDVNFGEKRFHVLRCIRGESRSLTMASALSSRHFFYLHHTINVQP